MLPAAHSDQCSVLTHSHVISYGVLEDILYPCFKKSIPVMETGSIFSPKFSSSATRLGRCDDETPKIHARRHHSSRGPRDASQNIADFLFSQRGHQQQLSSSAHLRHLQPSTTAAVYHGAVCKRRRKGLICSAAWCVATYDYHIGLGVGITLPMFRRC
jgi:hypothetical protein